MLKWLFNILWLHFSPGRKSFLPPNEVVFTDYLASSAAIIIDTHWYLSPVLGEYPPDSQYDDSLLMTAALIRCNSYSVVVRGEPSGHRSLPLPWKFRWQFLHNFHKFIFRQLVRSCSLFLSREILIQLRSLLYLIGRNQIKHFVAKMFLNYSGEKLQNFAKSQALCIN